MNLYFKRLVVILLFLFSFFILIGLFLPNKFTLKRTILVNAAPVQIHKYVNDLRMWPNWKNFNEIDSDIVIIPGNNTRGPGAFEKIKTKIGEGELKIKSSKPQNGIDYTVDLGRGLYHGESKIFYEDAEERTKVVWFMEGKTQIPILGGYLALRLDDYAGDFMERSLIKLKKLAESP